MYLLTREPGSRGPRVERGAAAEGDGVGGSGREGRRSEWFVRRSKWLI